METENHSVLFLPAYQQTINLKKNKKKNPVTTQRACIHISYINVKNAITPSYESTPSPGTEAVRLIKPSHGKQISCWTGSCQGSELIPPKLLSFTMKKETNRKNRKGSDLAFRTH